MAIHILHALREPSPTPQNGIFSSIIASFIQQASQALQPNNSQETVCLLSQLVSQGNSTQSLSQICPGPYPGEPSAAAIRSNILLVTSFFLAMAGAVACCLTHQWCDEFMKYSYPVRPRTSAGRCLFQRLNNFHMRNIMYGVRVVLIVSVVFFPAASAIISTPFTRRLAGSPGPVSSQQG